MRVIKLAASLIALSAVALTVQVGAAPNPIFCCACLANGTNHTDMGIPANGGGVALDCAEVGDSE